MALLYACVGMNGTKSLLYYPDNDLADLRY